MGFVANLLGGGGNDFKATPTALAQTDYNSALKQLMDSGALNPVNFNQANQTAQGQNQLAQMLFQQAQGQGPSIAQNQLKQATDQNIQQNASLLASQHGINPALAARQILQNQAAQGQQAAGQAATLRAQEQLGAQGTLGNVLGTQRGQDLGQALGQTQAGLAQVQGVGGLQQGQNALNVQNQQGTDQINAGVAEGNSKRGQGLLGGLLGGVGAIATGGLSAAVPSIVGAMTKSDGGIIPGASPLPGDSPVNDTVPAMLSPGEIVIPRTASKSPEKAKAFIDALKKRSKLDAGEEPSFGHVLAAQRQIHGRLSALEQLCYGGMAK